MSKSNSSDEQKPKKRAERKSEPKRKRKRAAQEPPGETKPPEDRVTRVRLRGQHERAEDAETFEGLDPEEVFRRALDAELNGRAYPLIEIVEGDVAFVDLDTHKLEHKPGDEELAAVAESVAPPPDAWWTTHGQGLRLVYIGANCEERAVASAFSAPQWFEVEIKRDSRHPHGAHPDRPGAKCGDVRFSPANQDAPVDWRLIGQLDEEAIKRLLEARDMRRGVRYQHSKCPIDGESDTNAGDCVVALEGGIYCHRCAAKGATFESCKAPGLAPYTMLAHGAARVAVLHVLARNLVHWTHARLHLRQEYPNLSDRLLQYAYGWALASVHGYTDQRAQWVFDPDLRVIQGAHAWFDACTRKEVSIGDPTLKALPAMYDRIAATGSDGEVHFRPTLRKPLLDIAKSGIPLDGYTPVHFVRGLVLHRDKDVIQVVVDPDNGERVELLSGSRLLDEAEAFRRLGGAFPGVDQNYLRACLAAVICAAQGSRPPIVMAVGPTGSGKGETARLAASFFGDERQTLAISKNEEQNWRRIGCHIEAGRRMLFIDEFLRRGDVLAELTSLLLQLSSRITWRWLYASADVQTVNRAAYFLAAGCVPDGFKKSPEIRRRMWLARLPRQVRNWAQTCGGDTAEWRARSSHNARVANSILTHMIELCAKHEFDFDRIAEALGLQRIDEGDAELQHDVLRTLYRHCRNEFNDRVMHVGKRYSQGRWVDAMSGPCQELLEQLVPDEDTDRPSHAGMIFQLHQNLQMVPWNSVLGIDDLAIQCQMRRHGGKVAIRFCDSSAKMRGQELINEDLPPIPDGDGDNGPSDGNGGGPGSDGPRDDGPLCQLCQPAWQNGDPAGDPKNADNGLVSPRYASYASSASLFEKSGSINGNKQDEQEVLRSAEEVVRKTLAQLAERRNSPENGVFPAECLAQRLAEQLTQRAAAPDDVADVLSAAGFPAQLLVLDFETYFDADYSLKKLTIPEYVHSPRFRAHGVAVRRPDGACEFRCDVDAVIKELQAEYGQRLERVTVAAHHLHFDGYILAKRYAVRPLYTTDTLALARHVLPDAGHKLAELAERFGLIPKGDALDGLSGVRELDAAQKARLSEYARHDAELCYDIATRLLPRLSRPEVELPLIDHTLKLFTERALPFDVDSAKQLLAQSREQLDGVLVDADVDRKTAGGKKLVDLLEAELVKDGRAVPTKAGKNGDIPALAKGDAGMKRLLDDPNPQISRLARARLAVKSAPQVEKRISRMINVAQSAGGKLPVALKYCGAHTGRYSGDGGVNLQNLPAHVSGLAGQIRGLLHAGAGQKLVIVDAAQIEARVLAWLADQSNLVQSFANGDDVYSQFASQVFGEAVRKPRDDDSPADKAKLKTRRQLGKVAVLGLGYQMGKQRFIDNVRSNPDLAAMLDSGALTESFLENVHGAYRSTYSQVRDLWYDVQDAFAAALREGATRTVSRLAILRDETAAYIELPSKRRLTYLEPKLALTGDMEYLGGKLYGGLLVENIVQGVARDILVDAMLRLENQGYPTVLTVHDEIILRVPEGCADAALNAAKTALTTPPNWAPGLPLGVEGHISDRYDK